MADEMANRVLTKEQRAYLDSETCPRWELNPPQRESFTDDRAYFVALGQYAERATLAAGEDKG
jgi:hypothetical protein